MEYYSAPKRNELSSYEKTMKSLSNAKKPTLYGNNCMTFWKRQKTMATVRRAVVARG